MCQNVLTLLINILPDFVTLNVVPLPEINFLVDVPLKTPEITKETAQYFGARKLIFRLPKFPPLPMKVEKALL